MFAPLSLSTDFSCRGRQRLGQATARLTGTVKDQSGGAIVGATVTLTKKERTSAGRRRRMGGELSVFTVAVGTYRLTVEHAGSRRNVQSGITWM